MRQGSALVGVVTGVGRVRGSGVGARLGCLLWAAAASGLFVLVSWGSEYWWIGVPVYGVAVAALLRSFFLGVWVGPGEVVVVSWFRRYSFTRGDVAAFDVTRYYGAGGDGVGWLPFIGSLRMIEVERASGRREPLPVTVGRSRNVVLLARLMKDSLEMNPSHL